MTSPLHTLRQTPQFLPSKFLAFQPGCFVQYYDDTDAKDPGKALSAPTFNVQVARSKQLRRCAICFSLQAFKGSRTKEEILSFRNLGVDVDLVPAADRQRLSVEEIDRLKELYLQEHLLSFPLKPHWLVETRHGFHAIIRVMPQRPGPGITEGLALNRRLVTALQGDENAALLTQVLRVPGTFQFKSRGAPFLCRLLLDNAGVIPPYELATVRTVLDAWERTHGTQASASASAERASVRPDWGEGIEGVPVGRRNATAASIIGGILGRLPERLWETAGWGGLKEWNRRNPVPLQERELRTVFENIARRERAGRQGRVVGTGRTPADILIRAEVRNQEDKAARIIDAPEASSVSQSAHAQC